MLTYVAPGGPVLAPKYVAAHTGRRAHSGKMSTRRHGVLSQSRAYFRVDKTLCSAVLMLVAAVSARVESKPAEANMLTASTLVLSMGLMARRSKAWLELAGAVHNALVVRNVLASVHASFDPRAARSLVRSHPGKLSQFWSIYLSISDISEVGQDRSSGIFVVQHPISSGVRHKVSY